MLFEQGWFGLLAFAGLTALALYRLARPSPGLDLAGVAGRLVERGPLFDSLLDAPRLAALMGALLLLGAGYRWDEHRRHNAAGKA